jgi:hypothetical protein
MNLSIFSKLPASDSPSGSLNSLDYSKTIRMALVVFLGAFCAKVAGMELTDASLQQVLLDAGQAGLAALGASAVELIRRFLAE